MRLFILNFILTLSCIVNAQEKLNNSFVLTGKVIGQDTGYVYLTYLNSYNKYIRDSFYLRKGEFKFFGSITEPCHADFYGNIKSNSVDDSNFTDIFIEPTKMQAIFKLNDFKHGEIAGSKSQNEFSSYKKQYEILQVNGDVIFNELDSARAKNDSSKIKFILINRIPFYRRAIDSMTYNFMKQNTGSYVSAYLLNFHTNSLTNGSLKSLYSLLTINVQQSTEGKKIGDYILKEENLQIGSQAPQFSQTDINGNNVSLKNYSGKFVLLEFWASWCAPCREETPYLKKAYTKFHEKGFTIISFSLDGIKTKKAWKDAIKQDSLSWPQVCDFKVWSGDVVVGYNLSGKGIPRNFLINPSGQIIAKDLRGDELQEKLAEVLK